MDTSQLGRMTLAANDDKVSRYLAVSFFQRTQKSLHKFVAAFFLIVYNIVLNSTAIYRDYIISY